MISVYKDGGKFKCHDLPLSEWARIAKELAADIATNAGDHEDERTARSLETLQIALIQMQGLCVNMNAIAEKLNERADA